jgi:hypothetical protein
VGANSGRFQSLISAAPSLPGTDVITYYDGYMRHFSKSTLYLSSFD